jgi:hypothetical protein
MGGDSLEFMQAFVVKYAERRFGNRHVEPLRVAAYELLSNALNYGSVTGDAILEIHEQPAIWVTNDTAPARLDMLLAQLTRLSKGAENTFVEEMQRPMSGSVLRPSLGLARIVHEAKMALDVYIVRHRVTMVARPLF